ncbi:gluconate 5-dehydrogenase [Yersinia pestis]|nr:gluconate 5-dehydrogenase [Yersinia pestis]QFR85439.1 gluconate 5-dehydrogenase [Yersinia pestis subsp. pestis bv. Medievalis]AYX19798.1 gluconate 5-dehydrogenase [Yersinia pestis]AYX25088.1 gluconate 5-dehydrogenase [Yersinia pestis]KAA5776069.1 gluconate 5-dehydrogenase [Yersinia pestis]
MDVFTASLRSACSLRRGHFVNNLRPAITSGPFTFNCFIFRRICIYSFYIEWCCI